MAMSVRIEVFRGPCTTPVLTLEPPYWDADQLKSDPRFVYEPEMQGYDDYVAVLTRDEFIELHERFRPLTEKGVWGCDSWKPHIGAMLKMLDGIIALTDGDWCRFEVSVFEWDSGF